MAAQCSAWTTEPRLQCLLPNLLQLEVIFIRNFLRLLSAPLLGSLGLSASRELFLNRLISF